MATKNINRVEITPATLVASLTPWIAPLLTAIFVMAGINRHFGSEQLPFGLRVDFVSLLAAGIIEFVGFSLAHTGLSLLRWNTKESRAKRYMMQTEFTIVCVCYVVYLGAVGTLVFVLDIIPEFKEASKLLFVILGAIGPITVAIQDRFAIVKAEGDTRGATKSVTTETASTMASDGQKRSQGSNIPERSKTPILADSRAVSGRFSIPVSGRTRRAAYEILAGRAAQNDEITGAELARLMGKGESTGRRLKRELWPVVLDEMGGNGHESE